MRKVLLLALVFALAIPAFAQKSVSGEPVPAKPFDPVRTEHEYEFTWADTEATSYGLPHWLADPDYWGDASAATFENDLGAEITLITLRFMCQNDDTDSSYWGIDTTISGHGAGQLGPILVSGWPTNDLYTAAEGFTAGTVPSTWTEVDVSGEGVTVADGDFFAVAYGLDEDESAGGSIGLSSGDTSGYTYSVYEGAWDQDQPWDATAVLNAVVSYSVETVETKSFGYIKGLYE